VDILVIQDQAHQDIADILVILVILE